jgi:hypothetical protein
MLSEKIISCYYFAMKKLRIFLITISLLLCSLNTTIAQDLQMSDLEVFSQDKYFGLKDKKDNIVVKAEYKKLIRLGNSSWIVQKKNKFGLIDCNGNYLIQPKYRHVERIFGKYVKLGNDNDYGLYDEYGKVVVPAEFSRIEPLFGKMFLTCKNYRYGIYNYNGRQLLENKYDDIYMPNPKLMRIQYEGEWYEIEEWKDSESIELPDNVQKLVVDDKTLKITHLISNTGWASGYSALTATDYALKLFSSISPAYEQTIDDLMFSQGAETVNIFIKLGWIPKFPFTYAKKYYANLKNPNNGPLTDFRNDLKRQIK